MGQRLLGQFEQAFTLTNETYGLVVVGVLRLRSGPPPDVLRQALDHLQDRHPLLQVVIAPKGKAFAFVPMRPGSPIPLNVLERQDDTHWERLAQQQLNQRFGPAEGPLMRCTYLPSRDPAGAADLICAFHHAIVDAASSIPLYHELLSRCAALQGDDVPVWEPGEPLVVLPPTERLLPPAYRGRRLPGRMMRFVARQVQQERRYRKETKGSRKPPLHAQSACHIHTLTLPGPATQALIKEARQERVTLNSVLAAALLLAVYRHRYPMTARPLQALVFSNLRPYLKPSPSPEHLGCYIAMQRVDVPVAPHDTLWTLARLLNASIYAANKRGDKFLAALLSKRLLQRALRKQNERMAAGALSYVGPLLLQPAYGTTEVTDVHGFITTNPLSPEYSAFGHLFLGRLQLDFMYMTADMDAGQAHAIAEEIKQLLQP